MESTKASENFYLNEDIMNLFNTFMVLDVQADKVDQRGVQKANREATLVINKIANKYDELAEIPADEHNTDQ